MLPFQNMSGDPEQEYFADGMVEDIITALSRIALAVRHRPQFELHLQGQAVDVKQVGRELGVRYVLEGSVRKAGNRVRITGQLIEAADGRISGPSATTARLEDMFEVQDEMTVKHHRRHRARHRGCGDPAGAAQGRRRTRRLGAPDARPLAHPAVQPARTSARRSACSTKCCFTNRTTRRR